MHLEAFCPKIRPLKPVFDTLTNCKLFNTASPWQHRLIKQRWPSQVLQSNIIQLWNVKYWSISYIWRITWKCFWNQGKRLPISYMAIHILYVWPGLLMSPNILNLYCASSKTSYQLTLHMAATSAYKLFTDLFPVYPYFLQSLTSLLYVINPMKYFTNQENTRKWISLPLSMATHIWDGKRCWNV
jgi:hypothetical protein